VERKKPAIEKEAKTLKYLCTLALAAVTKDTPILYDSREKNLATNEESQRNMSWCCRFWGGFCVTSKTSKVMMTLMSITLF
jgi:hypothetical protein